MEVQRKDTTAGEGEGVGYVPRYWTKRFIGECPVCGSDQGYVRRFRGAQPTGEPNVVYLGSQETYDGCDVF